MMIEIALLRPGSTDYDLQGRIQGRLDLPMAPQGEAEAAAMAEELRGRGLALIYSANSQPAIDTAELVAERLGIKSKRLDRLASVDMGLWQGLQYEEVRHKQPTAFGQWEDLQENVSPPEGETLGEAKERLQTELAKVLRKHTQGLIGLVLPRPLFELAVPLLGAGELGGVWQVKGEFGRWELLGGAELGVRSAE
jgi:probable phosphoglycerate mutase